MTATEQVALDTLFGSARTHEEFDSRVPGDDVLRRVYDLAKFAPTSFNLCPMRIVFVRSAEAKAKLEQVLAPGNIKQTLSAPVCAIIAHDMKFYEKGSILAPHGDFSGLAKLPETAIEKMALRNGSIQAGFLIVAARTCGLDCGPMSGFDQKKADELFLGGTTWKSNFLMNLGYGTGTGMRPRSPRLSFDAACRIE